MTYLLTLPPYAFYWFRLSQDAAAPQWSTATSGFSAEYHTFVLRNGLTDVVAERSRDMLLKELLPPYLAARRWYQGKGQAIKNIELRSAELLPDAGPDTLFLGIAVHAGDTVERYVLPLTIAWENDPSNPFEAPLALARVRKGRNVGLLTDAFATPRFAHAVMAGLAGGRSLPLQDGGALDFKRTDAFPAEPMADDAPVEWLAAESTNSVLVVGRHAMIKLIRRLQSGIHPEAEMTGALTARGFTGAPPLWGEVIRRDPDGTPNTVAVIQGFVGNQGNGWDWTLSRLAWVLDDNATPFGSGTEAPFEAYRGFAETLGRRIGEMHACLRQPSDDASFAPEMFSPEDAARVANAAHAQLDIAFDQLGADTSDLAAQRAALGKTIDALAKRIASTAKTRIHGDLHLGQTLVSSNDVLIIDFEGEPMKSLDERRAKASPMRDIAGMLRSFDYAAATVARDARLAKTEKGDQAVTTLLDAFRKTATDALLAGYEEGSGAKLTDIERDLIELFSIEKAAYEIVYEASNRPDWLAVPIDGLTRLAAVARHD